MKTQLQVISSYSLLHSPLKINELVASAKEYGYTSLALTDINNLYGSIDFYNASKKAGIKPIIGVTIEIKGLLNDSENYPLVILAKNNIGYQNLLKVTSIVNSGKDDYSIDDIQNFLSDLFVISTVEKNELLDIDEVDLYLNKIQNYLDEKSFFIGVTSNPDELDSSSRLSKISQQTRIPTVALGDVRYLNKEDYPAYKTLQLLQSGEKSNSVSDLQSAVGENYLKTPKEIDDEFKKYDFGSALINADLIAGQCNVEIEFKQPQLPKYKTPDNVSSTEFLSVLAHRGLEKRCNSNVTKEYAERLNYELEVIDKMGFADYFLIIWDVIKYSHSVSIKTGPGRGSAAGSLVSYSLGITQVDPIKYDLLFERFLNPQRVNMPDIDLDIPDNRRDELVRYMHDKYGTDHMAQIITYGTMAAKMSLRDVSRTFNQTTHQQSRWSSAIPRIPQVINVSLSEALEKSSDLRDLIDETPENKLIFKIAHRLEGIPRHYSKHAAGIVLSQSPLEETVSVQLEEDGINLTQQSKNNVEKLGLLKMDFLGLRNLSILDSATSIIRQEFDSEFRVEDIDLNDPATLELFQRGDTSGVFQFESDGIRAVLRRLKPTSFDDIVATNALYRPGPMDNIQSFIDRKHGKEQIVYPDSKLEDILKSTYGIIVYQEQVMQVSSEMAGYSLADADLLRRAISKKNEKLMNENRIKFVNGAIEKGSSRENAEKVFDYIQTFGNYGFNKSHSVAYSMLAFWLAYIKVHFPAAFYTCLLNSVKNDSVKIPAFVSEAKKRKVIVNKPDINKSEAEFSIIDGNIYFGLLDIKGVRKDLANNIIENRSEEPYQNISQLLKRIESRYLKKEYIEPLVFSGALDNFNPNRRELLLDIRDQIESIGLAGTNLFLNDLLDPKQNQVDDFTLVERLNQEKEYLGTFVSGHPVAKYRENIADNFTLINELEANLNNNVTIFGQVSSQRVIRTKKGQQMEFLTLTDETGEISVTVFPQLYSKLSNMDLLNKMTIIKGKLQKSQRGSLEIIADIIDNDLSKKTVSKQNLYIRLDNKIDLKFAYSKIEQIIKDNPGNVPVIIVNEQNHTNYELKNDQRVKITDELQKNLQDLVGKSNIIVKNRE
ncbi:DNA polymerase III subunit alpha [Lactobacillus terrae]|uniref:DNA polymerase III subunit alpha n=1 Tax=Lactobacillus terrae TaxID=2269374 RepID=UPI000C1B76E6|nr:DNA polymerase III subunit alpha [Lactobacillus terrae]